MFELKEREGLARICELTTKHGRVTTPVLLPVINPNQITISPKDMKEKFGVQMLITNSYIIRGNPESTRIAQQKGVHALLGFDGPVMTDSGTFQDHVYGDVTVDYEEIVKFQSSIGSDVGTILDVFSEPDFTRKQTEDAVNETIRRAKGSVAHKGDMLLAGTVQGGVYPDLRERCSQELSQMPFDVHPIGGVVPLLENYWYSDLAKVILASKRGLDPSRPVHLFGAGHPMIFPLAVLLGCDMFDSASYAKYAREERLMYPTGTRFLRDLHDLACHCPACSRTSVQELKKMDAPERTRILAEHNLHTCLKEIKAVKNAIHEQSIWEMVEMRARAHPALLDALKILKNHKDYLERFEPSSRRGAFFYCGPESYDRPAVSRYQERLFSRYRRPKRKVLVGFGEAKKPYSRTFRAEIERISKFLTEMVGGAGDKFDIDMMRCRAVLDMQLGRGAADILDNVDVKLVKSERTGKIRNVMIDGMHALSMRAADGRFTLKIDGARLLMKVLAPPKMRVTVDDEPAEFAAKGNNVFAKFVKECDVDVRPGDDVLVVNTKGELAAVGRALMNREEMLAFKRGVAVRVKDSPD
jgi:7-cyano-7-deazaguanine tRNA-ribosyltransferase